MNKERESKVQIRNNKSGLNEQQC